MSEHRPGCPVESSVEPAQQTVPAEPDALLEVAGLRIELAASGHTVIDGVDLTLIPGEVVAIVGESGCGKTSLGMSLLGYCRDGARIAQGTRLVAGQDLEHLSPARLRKLRGGVISYIPQDPPSSLNPSLRLKNMLDEVFAIHAPALDKGGLRRRSQQLMDEVSLPTDDTFLRKYPHQLSGGQQQRFAIALAFACTPQVIVCDEPTTGLDVFTQSRVLETLTALRRAHGSAILYITHDLSVVRAIAERVVVMYAGRIIEQGRTEELFRYPRHPYTAGLLAATPTMVGNPPRGIPGEAPSPGNHPAGCWFAPRCSRRLEDCSEPPPATPIVDGGFYRCFNPMPESTAGTDPADVSAVTEHPSAAAAGTPGSAILRVENLSAGYGGTPVVHNVGFELAAGESLGLVGESGSGKSTLSRCLVGLHSWSAGEVVLDGVELTAGLRHRTAAQRRDIQYIFQNPYGSLNPQRTVRQALAGVLRLHTDLRGSAATARASELLSMVSLNDRYLGLRPRSLSGGERQRVAIARALASNPKVLVCDEITASLDVSVQASIVELLRRLQQEIDLSLIFVTHDLPLVRSLAHRIAVMSAGEIVELSVTEELFRSPQHPYTRKLLSFIPAHSSPA